MCECIMVLVINFPNLGICRCNQNCCVCMFVCLCVCVFVQGAGVSVDILHKPLWLRQQILPPIIRPLPGGRHDLLIHDRSVVHVQRSVLRSLHFLGRARSASMGETLQHFRAKFHPGL